jgi:hypothetical protein
VDATFSSDRLLRDDYTQKPSFQAYRNLIATLGARVKPPPKHHRRDRRHHRRRRARRR